MENSLELLVSGIYSNLVDNSYYSITYISGWALNPTNLGWLNNNIDKCYSGIRYTGESGQVTGYAISPDLCSAELSLYSMYFENFFWNNAAKMAISGAGAFAASQWTKIEEGDSKITKRTSVETAKALRELSKSAREDLDASLRVYKSNHATPQHVYGTDIYGGHCGRYGNYHNWYSRYRLRD